MQNQPSSDTPHSDSGSGAQGHRNTGAPAHKPRKTLKIAGAVVLVAVVAFLGGGFIAANSPAGKQRSAERATIAQCWQSARSGTADAGMCRRLEALYRGKWNREP